MTYAQLVELENHAMDFPVGSPQRTALFKFIRALKETMAGTTVTGEITG